jgi:hypothetical protein
MALKSPVAASHDSDFAALTREQADILHARDWGSLDLDHLIEELEDMGDSRLDALESALIRIVEHLLELDFGRRPEPFRGWRLSIATHRVHARRRLKRSPSPARRADLAGVYAEGRTLAAAAFRLYGDGDPEALPTACPWTLDELLDDDCWPVDRHSPA